MKTIISDYTFNALSGTVTFDGYSNISLERILLITNVTDNIVIYNFADAAKGGTVSTNVLTFTYDTSSMANSDELQIWYWEDSLTTEIAVDTVDSTITYIGKAKPASLTSVAVWQIKRIDEDGTDLNVTWADGNANFDNIWDNRQSLTYN